MVAWLRRMLGLPDAFDGMFTDTASMSSLLAIVAARQPSLSGSTDGFMARVRLAPATVLYSSYLGGSRRDYVHDLVVDDNGAVFLVGGTDSTDFPAPNAVRPIGRVPLRHEARRDRVRGERREGLPRGGCRQP